MARPRPALTQYGQAMEINRINEANQLIYEFRRILELHRVDFPPATRPVAPVPQQPDRAAINRHYEKQTTAGISLFHRAERAEAKRRAEVYAETEVQRQWAEACQRQAQWQEYLDHRWDQLRANDPDVVLETLAEAFEDNEAPSAAVGVENGEVSLVVLVPPVHEVVPEQMPTTTAAGNLTFRKLPQRDQADYYKQFVAAQVLVTVCESFAVAPAVEAASVVVLRNDGCDAYGRPRVPCVLAVRLTRQALVGIKWESAGAADIVDDAADARVSNERGRSRELTAIDLSGEPAIAQIVAVVDLAELTATG